MDFLQLAADRYSARSFSGRPIEQEKMDRILKAGQLAPTAVNFQPQKIFILKSKEAIQKIRTLTHFAYDAPAVLLFCADTTKVWRSPTEHGYDTGEMDVSIVCTHMMLEAWELGIGSVWVREFDSRQVARPLIYRNISSRSVCFQLAIPAKCLSPMRIGIIPTVH